MTLPKLKGEAFHVELVMKEIFEKMAGKASKFGISIESSLEEAVVWMDKESFVQILINLIDNAIKYNITNGRIIVRSYGKEGAYVIEIEDTGIGIPDEHKERIFEPFYTIDKNRSKTFSGTGLGLSLVQKLLNKQNGSIRLVDSKKSTILKVQIPFWDDGSF